LSLKRPTVWLVRRLVEYKSQYPVLKDIVHVLCADRDQEVDSVWGRMSGLGMQVVVGGIAPQNTHEETWVQKFIQWMQRPDLHGRFVYVPGCDTTLLRMQAIGADICLNCPQPQKEACGTSDQRSARNGGLNVAVQSGGPPEYLEDGHSGMLIGPYINSQDFFERAPKDILDKLRALSDMFAARTYDDARWRDMKFAAYLASGKVTARAMEQRYADIYTQAIASRCQRLEQDAKDAIQIMPLHTTDLPRTETVSKTG
jgi:glucan phosphorylase